MIQDFVVFCFFSYLIIQLVRFVLADADLTLLWKEKFGKKPDVLKGSVVWITGASSGIGEYLAYELAKAGCRLVLSARREDELDRVKQQCLVHGNVKENDVMVLPMDMLKLAKHKEAVDKVLGVFTQIDILVNNSGRTQRGLAIETSLAVDREIMELNYFATISLTKVVLSHMAERKAGHIVVTSSIAGKIGSPFSAAYSATKFALQGWFDTLRVEATMEKISVTMICPGPVMSDISKNAFSDTVEKPSITTESEQNIKKISTERCAELMAIAIANRLDEVWISFHPVLALVYLQQYMPAIAMYVLKKTGMKFVMKRRFNIDKIDQFITPSKKK